MNTSYWRFRKAVGGWRNAIRVGNNGFYRHFGEQFAYGHINALRRYCGKEQLDHVLEGRLPHGGIHIPAPEDMDGMLRPIDGMFSPIFSREFREITQFAWNQGSASAMHASGVRKVRVIGAPWAYLLRSRSSRRCSAHPPQTVSVEPRELLVFPTHGWSASVLSTDYLSMNWLPQVEATQTTICLGWAEYLKTDIVQPLELKGFQVVCNGFPFGASWGNPELGGTRLFLERLYETIDAHRSVLVDGVSSAAVYGASLGKNLVITKTKKHTEYSGHYAVRAENAGMSRDKFESAVFEVLRNLERAPDDRDRNTLLAGLLGQEHLLSTEQMSSELVPRTWSYSLV